MNALKNEANYTFTENGAITHRTTKSDLLDMFALGGAMRKRSDEDVILMFRKAFAENPVYALKCLFYLRDVRGGQGERRFFRLCMKDLAVKDTATARRNMRHVPEFGRWDDLYLFVGTPLEKEMFAFMKEQLALDVQSKTPSLLAKWLKSENTSSADSRLLAHKTREAFGMNHKQYRKTLAVLRERINIVERLMSENRWDEIEFDKIPSKAGLIYKNAFARHDIERMKNENVQSYADFAKDTTKKVNAEVLNPVDIADQIFRAYHPSETERLMWDKYWANLKDYYNGREENGIAICDVSGSMTGQPMNAAVSMSAYIAERGKGPFKNHFITFSSNPALVEFEGVDTYDKFRRAIRADWGMSTNVEAALDMMLDTAIKNNVPAEDMPTRLYIFSDMEFNGCMTCGPANSGRWYEGRRVDNTETLFETIAKRWEAKGYELPKVIFWNLDARQNNIPALGGRFSYVSGFSMNMVETILSGKDGYDLMMDKLSTERYAVIG
jgi:hypothetical protein